MSKIGEQVRRIRTMADIIYHGGIQPILTEAADTIEDLSAKLATENMEKLIEYKNLEEQGKILKLPCALGSTVYLLRIDNTAYMMSNKKIWEIVEERFEIRHFDCIGKTVFFTKSEAEWALKEMEGKK